MVSFPTRRRFIAGATAGLAGTLSLPGQQVLAQSTYVETDVVDDATTVRGFVKYAGPQPELQQVAVLKDSVFCGPEDRTQQALRVSDTGALADCVVQISGVTQGKAWSPLRDEAKVFQVECSFKPYVQFVRTGAMLRVINVDTILHNVHAHEIIGRARRTLFNFAQPKAGQEDRVPMKLRRGHIVSLNCNVHNWMAGWIYIADTPYLTTTAEDGSFEIDGIPPGVYGLSIWHPVLGEQAGQLEILPGGDLDLDLVWN